jgi:hypothetical protein
MNHDLLTEFVSCHSMRAKEPRHHLLLEILAELWADEQGIEELEGMLR